MLELIFVIVIVGIVTAMVIPRMDRDTIFEATNQTLNHIKYTQHLAMTQDVYNDQAANWFRARWEIQFFACGGYAVHSDSDLNGNATAARGESAFDPQTKKRLWIDAGCTTPGADTDFAKANLLASYSVNAINFAGCNNNQQISFDSLGRPYTSNTINAVLKQNCDITLTSTSGENETIRIHPETGYACMLNAAGTCI